MAVDKTIEERGGGVRPRSVAIRRAENSAARRALATAAYAETILSDDL